MIDASTLRRATGCSQALAELFAPLLDEACQACGINTTARLAGFLGQITVESGALAYVREIASGEAYEGRQDLGNTQPGDGVRYKGRGLIQLTGRNNYRAASAGVRVLCGDAPDFEAHPEMAEQSRWAAWTAAWWWLAHGANEVADRRDWIGLGRLVNRGSATASKPANAEAERQAATARALRALEPDSAAPPAAPAATPSMPAGEAPDWQPPQENKPMGPFVIPAIVELAKAIPSLAGMFANTEVAQRNAKAAEVVLGAVMPAVQAATEQEAVKKVAADPAAAAAAHQAIQGVWYEITEGGSGGYDGARKAEAAFMAQPAPRPWLSPSMWAFAALAPLAYLIVLSVVGLIGNAKWPAEVQASIASAVISLIVGGAAGFYWGASTKANQPTR